MRTFKFAVYNDDEGGHGALLSEDTKHDFTSDICKMGLSWVDILAEGTILEDNYKLVSKPCLYDAYNRALIYEFKKKMFFEKLHNKVKKITSKSR